MDILTLALSTLRCLRETECADEETERNEIRVCPETEAQDCQSRPPDLEPLLAAIEAEARGRVPGPTSMASVRSLLEDCRAIALEGKPDTALALAQHLSRGIPSYLTAKSGG
jgi:hypothetical protein